MRVPVLEVQTSVSYNLRQSTSPGDDGYTARSHRFSDGHAEPLCEGCLYIDASSSEGVPQVEV